MAYTNNRQPGSREDADRRHLHHRTLDRAAVDGEDVPSWTAARGGRSRIVPAAHARRAQGPRGEIAWRRGIGVARGLALAMGLLLVLGMLGVDAPSLRHRLSAQPSGSAVQVGPHGPAQGALRATQAMTPELAFSALDYTVDEGAGSAVVTVTLSTTSSQSINVDVSTTDENATADEDYSGTRLRKVVSPGASFFTFTVTIIDDTLVEGEESFSIVLSNAQNATLAEDHEAFVHIRNDDEARLSITDTVVAEHAGRAVLTVTQSTTSTLQSLVDVQTQDGSAQEPADYHGVLTTASIPPGGVETTVTVPIVDDGLAEPTESFTVTLVDPLNAVLGRDAAAVVIEDDEALPQLSVAYTETREAAGAMHFVASLDAAAAMTVTAAYQLQDGDAVAPADYQADSGVLTLPPGERRGVIVVTLVDDEVAEPDETLHVVLSQPQNAVLVQAEATGLILNDDVAGRLFLPRLLR